MKTKITLTIIALLALLGVGLFASQPSSTQAQDAVSGKAAELQAELQNPALDAQTRASLEEKLAMAQRMASEKSAGARQPAPKQPGTPPDFGPQVNNEINPPTGIFEGGEAIIHGYQATILNHWQDMPDGILTQVYAGAVADDPEQGVLYVVVWNAENMPRITRYLTPSRDGTVRILAAQDGLLKIESSGGSAWNFDWRSGEFH